MTKSEKTEQVIGELVLYAPLIAVCAALGALVPCIISMVCLSAYKQCYAATVHLDKACQCVALSYGIFIAVCLFYNGLARQFWFMKSQPLLLVVIIAGIAWMNASAGQWQQNYKDALTENAARKALIAFNCKTSTATEIQARARKLKLSDEQAGWIVDKFVLGITYKKLCRPEESEKACQARIRRIVRKINSEV